MIGAFYGLVVPWMDWGREKSCAFHDVGCEMSVSFLVKVISWSAYSP